MHACKYSHLYEARLFDFVNFCCDLLSSRLDGAGGRKIDIDRSVRGKVDGHDA